MRSKSDIYFLCLYCSGELVSHSRGTVLGLNKVVFEAFNNGNLAVPGKVVRFEQIEWSKHPIFEGVELKHIITAKETDGKFSYHVADIFRDENDKDTYFEPNNKSPRGFNQIHVNALYSILDKQFLDIVSGICKK